MRNVSFSKDKIKDGCHRLPEPEFLQQGKNPCARKRKTVFLLKLSLVG
jgi:hypothetical protein